jgi:hypothetical protein
MSGRAAFLEMTGNVTVPIRFPPRIAGAQE